MAVRITTSVRVSTSTVNGPNWIHTGLLLVILEELVDLVAHLTVGHSDIVLGVTIVAHQVKVSIVRNVKLFTHESVMSNLRLA